MTSLQWTPKQTSTSEVSEFCSLQTTQLSHNMHTHSPLSTILVISKLSNKSIGNKSDNQWHIALLWPLEEDKFPEAKSIYFLVTVILLLFYINIPPLNILFSSLLLLFIYLIFYLYIYVFKNFWGPSVWFGLKHASQTVGFQLGKNNQRHFGNCVLQLYHFNTPFMPSYIYESKSMSRNHIMKAHNTRNVYTEGGWVLLLLQCLGQIMFCYSPLHCSFNFKINSDYFISQHTQCPKVILVTQTYVHYNASADVFQLRRRYHGKSRAFFTISRMYKILFISRVSTLGEILNTRLALTNSPQQTAPQRAGPTKTPRNQHTNVIDQM